MTYPSSTLRHILLGATILGSAGAATPGTLVRLDRAGEDAVCPLKHTDVKADISGVMARVVVTQTFYNPSSSTIEAMYVFPLPHRAAVNAMNIKVGDRTIKGSVKTREEARKLYEQARNSGRIAGLLDQERPNIFAQSIANITPGSTVKVEIQYMEQLPYESGKYEFLFPMVVGPRYMPQGATGNINPPVAAKGARAGHDISVSVKLNAGAAIQMMDSNTHEIEVAKKSGSFASLRLRTKNEIPNKDFRLTWSTARQNIGDSLLTHKIGETGYFNLVLEPPARIMASEIIPRELVFVLDTSGSMNGFPIEKAKESMRYALDTLNPRDTFNLITFAGDTRILFQRPVAASAENIAQAKRFIDGHYGSGGTEMMKAIRASLDGAPSDGPMRVVCFMTDGYVGNEAEILAEIDRHPNARIFSFGIGSAVNHYLLDKMAEHGRGEVDYVNLSDDGSLAAKRFSQRVHDPLLTDIRLEWNGLPVKDVEPTRVLDLFSAKPIVLAGRYTRGASGKLKITGKMAGKGFERVVDVNLPDGQPENSSIATLWARRRIDALESANAANNRDAITKLGLDFQLMTAFTSFVAVEDRVVNEGGHSRTVQVPVELPEGTRHEGFGMGGGVQPGVAGVAMSTPGFASEDRMAVRAKPMNRPYSPAPNRVWEVEPRQEELSKKISQDVVTVAANGGAAKVEIRLYVTDVNDANLAALKKLGFEVISRPGQAKLLIGRISSDKLSQLAALAFVQHITGR